MEDQIMSFNEGLPSRFPLLFKFPDYTDQQLHDIFMGQLESGKPAFTLEEAKYARIAAKRCAWLLAASSYIEATNGTVHTGSHQSLTTCDLYPANGSSIEVI